MSAREVLLCAAAGGAIALRDLVLGTPRPRGWRGWLVDTAFTWLIVGLALAAGMP